MSATPPSTGGLIDRGPPCLGEDTSAILEELLGLTSDDISALADDGVLS
jgi:crotonobetainyl-CoA:carnitine CoA-transferase CaiB-like acyl-CoA transferase